MAERTWYTGVIRKFNGTYGFIRVQGTLPQGYSATKDVHFHQNHGKGMVLQQGLSVEFRLSYKSQPDRPSACELRAHGAQGFTPAPEQDAQSNRDENPRPRSGSRERSGNMQERDKPAQCAASQGPQRGFDRRSPRTFHTGRICFLHPSNSIGFLKPIEALGDDYPKDKNVRFQPNKVHTAGMSLKEGDVLHFTLGTQDKSCPMAFNLKLLECSARSDEDIQLFLDKSLEEIEDVRKDTVETEDDTRCRSQYLVDLLSCPAVWQAIGRCPDINLEATRKCLKLLLLIKQKMKTLRQNFASTLKTLAGTPITSPPSGSILTLIKRAVRTCSQNDLDLARNFILAVFQEVPEKAHAMIPLLKPMVSTVQTSTEAFLYTAMKEVTKRLATDIDDMEWDELPLVPSVSELTCGPLENTAHLTPVKAKGPYESPQEYMDINFRLLRADSFHSLRSGIRNYLEGKLDPRDMNIYLSVKLVGVHVSKSEGGVSLLIQFFSPRKIKDWSKNSNLMFGNLLCISPSGTFKDPIWATVLNRDVKMLQTKSTIMVELCPECNTKSDSDLVLELFQLGQCAVMAESPAYYRAYQPVLVALQSMDPNQLPFQEELIQVACPERRTPTYINHETEMTDPAVILNSDRSDIRFEDFVARITSDETSLDKFQSMAMTDGLSSRLSIIQGPPGTGKTYIGTKLVQILLSLSTKPQGPILALTYKNHALDEFLKPLAQVYPEDVVRVGGRSKDPDLEAVNLHEVIRQTPKNRDLLDRLREKYAEIDSVRPKVVAAAKALAMSQHFTFSTLLEYASSSQVKSLLLGCDWHATNIPSIDIEKRRTPTKNFVIDLLSQPKCSNICKILQNPGQDETFKILVSLAELAMNIWQPRSQVFLAMEQQQPFAGANQPGYRQANDENSDEEVFDEEDIKEREQERMAPMSQSKALQGDTITFPEFSKQNTQPYLMSSAKQLLMQFPVREMMVTEDLWTLSEVERVVFIQALLLQHTEDPQSNFERKMQEYQQLCEEKNELDDQHKVSTLSSKKIIGMTITGASIQHQLLSRVQPAIVVVEEAAEVLEAQIIAVLGEWVQHLILIGDHKQLRPPVENYELCKNYHFDVSMMERLINNGIRHTSLGLQNRMRIEFAELLLDIYPALQSNERRVAQNQQATCMAKSMYFWDHTDPEKAERSCSNDLEAERAIRLALFLVQQGYNQEQITLLCAYQGQVALVRKKLILAEKTWPAVFPHDEEEAKESSVKRRHKFRVHTIDMYQGDENDFVIVSLVRSHAGHLKGFLKFLNRRCVAQSRAKCGMYFIGNADVLSTNNHWKTLITKMRDRDCVGTGITLQCPKHPASNFQAVTASNIDLGTFCRERCVDVMSCGQHPCPEKCQPPHSHDYCKHQVTYTFPNCAHRKVKDCSKDGRTLKCTKPCEVKMPCNVHACTHKCAPEHGHNFCVENVEFNFPKCGHRGEKKCSDPVESMLCKEEVPIILKPCEHLGRKQCFQEDSKIRCEEKCPKMLPCNHPCAMKCGEPCVSSKCKECEKILKAENERKRRIAEEVRKAAMEKARKELEELKKKPLEDLAVTELLPEGDTAAEYFKVEDMVKRYVQPTHKWYPQVKKVEKVFNQKLQIAWLEARQKLFDPGQNSDLKFHGTSKEAASKIIEDGFRLPVKPGMYGKGVYFATDSSKSAQEIYTKGSNILLLCDVLLGRTKTVDSAVSNMSQSRLLTTGYDSLYAKRGTKDTKGVLYDEFVVYNPAQALPRYVIHYDTVDPGTQIQMSDLTATALSKSTVTVEELKPKRQADPNDKLDMHFRRAESQFLRLMVNMGKSHQITSVDLYTNPPLICTFRAKTQEMASRYSDTPEAEPVLAFHGTKPENIDGIMNKNFDLSLLSKNTGDQGWYGAGIYFSEIPAISIGYGGNGSLILCEVLPGKSYDCPGRMDGQGLKAGFDSHRYGKDKDERAQELVIFDKDQILPRYVIHFK